MLLVSEHRKNCKRKMEKKEMEMLDMKNTRTEKKKKQPHQMTTTKKLEAAEEESVNLQLD